MFRFFFGILLIQVISLVVFWVNMDITITWSTELALKIGLPLLLLAITTALWFDAVGRSRATHTLAKLQESHAREREKLQIKSEREKHKVIKDAHKQITRQSRLASGKANLKVGLAFAVAACAGVLMLITELVTFGMMTLMTAGGALSGYLFRAKRERLPVPINDAALDNSSQPRVINETARVLESAESDGGSR